MKKETRISIFSVLYIVFCSYLGALFLTYWLNEFVKFSGIYDYFKEALFQNPTLVYQVVWEICFFISYIISIIITYFFQKKRKNFFIKETKGLIKKRDGLIFHFQYYWIQELCIAFLVIGISIFFQYVNSYFSPFALIYTYCGNIGGTVLTFLWVGCLHICSILFSQYEWRVVYYRHD